MAVLIVTKKSPPEKGNQPVNNTAAHIAAEHARVVIEARSPVALLQDENSPAKRTKPIEA